LSFEIGELNDELIFLLLQLGSFVTYDRHQKLILKSVRSNREVNESDFNADFRQVVRIGELGRYYELEVIVVRNELVTEFDRPLALDLNNTLGQNWLKRRI